MSLAVVVKGPEGVVLAADSRATLEFPVGEGPHTPINFDNATKILSFSEPHNYVGVVTYGTAAIGLRTAHSYVPEFELTLEKEKRLAIKEYAERLSKFFVKRWKETSQKDQEEQNIGFIVGGYDRDAAYGEVFGFEIPRSPEPQPKHAGDHEFGMSWRGQTQIANRLLNGCDPATFEVIRKALDLDEQQVERVKGAIKSQLRFPIPFPVLPLQDCIDLAIFLIRSTITAQHFAVNVRAVGGPIEVACITRIDGLKYVQKKEVRGEFE